MPEAVSSLDERSLDRNLGRLALEGLRRAGSKPVLVDCTGDTAKPYTGAVIAATALAFAKELKRTVADDRVGLVLPTGVAATIANLGVVLAGKTPVNLNFTIGPAAIRASIANAGINTVYTVAPMRQKLADFPWPDDTRDFSASIQGFGKWCLGWRLAVARILPASWTASFFRVPATGGDREAGIMFSSGSSGTPKGVVLTHRNIVANVLQMWATGLFGADDECLLASLPVFHSFSCSVTIWLSLAKTVRTVTLPTPLDARKLAKAVAQQRCTILIGTPTFLRPHLTRTEPADFASLRWIIAGAEKTPEGMHEAFEKRFPNAHFIEGYGITETSPVVSINLPDLDANGRVERPSRPGSVGRLLTCMEARLLDPDSRTELPRGASGILALKGPNVFKGYLNDPERTAECLVDGWFVTGDIARIDDEGFIFIEGRLSRFSKIGGEMVPHGTVETSIAKALGIEQSERPLVAVMGLPDASKGESLLLLAATPVSLDDLRTRLAEQGLPNLWIPKRVATVPEIPLLPTGKLDLGALRRLADANK